MALTCPAEALIAQVRPLAEVTWAWCWPRVDSPVAAVLGGVVAQLQG